MKKKNSVILFAVSVLVLLVGCNKSEQGEGTGPEPGEAPSIELKDIEEGNMLVPPEGGPTVIQYSIANPVEGGKMSAISQEDWAGEFNCETDGEVSFVVMENEGTEARNSILTLTYTYGEEDSVRLQVNLIQEAGYAYTMDASCITASYYKDIYGRNGEDNYYTWLSDEPFMDEQPVDGGTYYLLSIYLAGDPEDPEHPLPVAGTYSLGTAGGTDDMTMSIDESHYVSYPEGQAKQTLYFTEGTLTVSYEEDGTLTYDAVLTDTNGDRHHVVYSGEVSYIVFGGEGPEPGGETSLDHDVELSNPTAQAQCMFYNGNVMNVIVSIYGENNSHWLELDMLLPFDQDGHFATGTYEVARRAENVEAMDIVPGVWFDNAGFQSPDKSWICEYNDGSTLMGLIMSGTVDVSGSPGSYVLAIDLATDAGYKVTGSVKVTEINRIPEPFSTITSDRTLDLSGAEASLSYYGDAYGTGGDNWYLKFNPTADGDGLMMDLVSDRRGDWSKGIPSGVYKVSNTDEIYPGHYYPGYNDYGYIGGSMYFYDVREGVAYGMAPALDGDFTVTNHGDGTYDIEFSFTDDRGNIWDGSWSGELMPQQVLYTAVTEHRIPVAVK